MDSVAMKLYSILQFERIKNSYGQFSLYNLFKTCIQWRVKVSPKIYKLFLFWWYLLIKSKYKRHAFQHAFRFKDHTNSWNRFKWLEITHNNLNFQLKLSNTSSLKWGHSLCACILPCVNSFFYSFKWISAKASTKTFNTMQI